jgi:hypothetical protein
LTLPGAATAKAFHRLSSVRRRAVRELLLQLLEHRLGKALFVRAGIEELKRGDFGLVRLDVLPEGGAEFRAGLRALLGGAGVEHRVLRDHVDGLSAAWRCA